MKNRLFLILGVVLLVIVTVAAVSQPLTTAKSVNLSLPARPMIMPVDQSYNMVEQIRLTSFYNVAGYDKIEQLRSGRGLSADRSYDKIEAIRLGR